MRATFSFASAIVLVCLAAGTEPAHAACKRFGFTVNDYGKEGPIKDAKALLDKHIAKWTADQGISDYQTGKKDVSCELFLNFIVFDEHTCTASANVCWGGDQAKVGVLEEAEGGPPPTPVRKLVAQGGTPKAAAAEHEAAMSGAEATPKSTTVEATAPAATDEGPAAPAEKAAAETPPSAADTLADTMSSTGAAGKPDEPAEPAQTAEKDAAQKPAAEPPPAAGVAVETGALPDNGASAPSGKPSPESPVKTLAAYPDKDQAAAAAAAATAAAAAERAAAAAESAAAAAKEAAAAAVAASAASRGTIVPPLDPMPGADKAARAGTVGAH
jgi:hypothetical protein